MKNLKKLLALLLAMVMVVGMFPMTAMAEGEETPTCATCGSTEHTEHPADPTPCATCGSTEHTEHPADPTPCATCGSTEHTEHPADPTPCATCGSTEHTEHPADPTPCATCGSTEHTEHPAEPEKCDCGLTKGHEGGCQKNEETVCGECGQTVHTTECSLYCAFCGQTPCVCKVCTNVDCGVKNGHNSGCSLAPCTVCLDDPCSCSLYEKLMAAESVEAMYAQVQDIVNGDDADRIAALMALTFDELEELRERVNELDPEGDDVDTEDMLDMLSALPNATCPDCGLTGEHEEDCPRGQMEILATAWDGSQTNGDFTVSGTVTINQQVTIGQDQTLTLTGSGKIQRATNYLGNLFSLTGNGKLVITGESGTIVIDGNNQWTQANDPEQKPTSNGTEATGSFVVMSGESAVTMENVIMQNNWVAANSNLARSSGGAIQINGAKKVTLTNCVIQRTYAAYGGSAIFSNGKTEHIITLNNCVIQNCTIWYDHVAAGTGDDGNEGGAIRTNGGTDCRLIVNGGEIKNNMSSGMGGGIYFNSGGDYAQLTNNVKITGNKAATYGGGILLMTQLTLDSASITNNSAKYGGGLAFRPFNTGSSESSYYKPGTTELYNALRDGSMELSENIIISNNTASEKGGGMYIEVGNVRFNTMEQNNAPMTVYPTRMVLDISGATLANNSSNIGGAIYMSAVEFTQNGTVIPMEKDVVSGLNFNSGVLKNNTATNGGGIYLHSIPVNIGSESGNTLIENNNATTGNGGGFFISNMEKLLTQEPTVTIQNVTVKNNNALTGNGGAIYICGSDSITVPTTLKTSTVQTNKATNGGAICVESGSLIVESGTISNNIATQNGGAAYVSGGNLTMSGGTMTNNTATTNGGGAYVAGGNITMTGGSISSNAATGNGGAAYISVGILTMNNGTVSNNNAVNGGAMYVNDGDLIMENGSITGNIASGNGGAAYVGGGDVTIYHGTINGNKAIGTTDDTGSGGAVYMNATDAILIMESGTMNGNEAANDGGAIFANGGTIKIGLDACKGETKAQFESCTHHIEIAAGRHHPEIKNNKAADTGGGIAIANDGVVHFFCGTATGNKALYKGVGKNVFMDGGVFNLYDGANIGVPRDPDLVIVGGTLNNKCENIDYVNLYYYQHNTDTTTAMVGLAQYQEIMNLPDGEYFWDAPEGYVFLGWTAKGAASGGADSEVRNKEQYVNSGEPVEILDAPSTGTDQTAINTNRLFDGTTDEPEDNDGKGKIMHLYALWAPKQSAISYVDGITNETIDHTPVSYEFKREDQSLTIQPVEKQGYDLIGWYIYQDDNQNANWNDTLTDITYEPDNANRKYLPLTSRNSALALEVAATNFGDITLIADFTPAFTDLRIKKEGCNSLDENQSFIVNIKGQPTNTELAEVDINVVLYGNDDVLIEEIPVGNYTVKELSDWSWRYGTTTVAKGTSSSLGDPVNGTLCTIEISDSTIEYAVKFNNARTKIYWLDGDSWCVNKWNGTGITATNNPVS